MDSPQLTAAKERLALYMEAEGKVLGGQSYTIGTRSLTRADLAEIRKGLQFWTGQVSRLALTGGTGPVHRSVVPLG